MRKWLIAVSVVASACVADHVYAQMQLRQLMIDKLQASQKLLEAIAKGDFKQIGQQADRLSEIANQAEWMAFKTPKYELHSNEFRRAAETVARKAKDKNLDGVTLAYMDLTMSWRRAATSTRTRGTLRLSVPSSRRGACIRALATASGSCNGPLIRITRLHSMSSRVRANAGRAILETRVARTPLLPNRGNS